MLYPPELLLEQSLLQGHGLPPGLDKEAEMLAKTWVALWLLSFTQTISYGRFLINLRDYKIAFYKGLSWIKLDFKFMFYKNSYYNGNF